MATIDSLKEILNENLDIEPEKVVESATFDELGIDSLDMADLICGKRVVLMDDVISTGGSLRAMEDLVALAGGTVVARIAVLAEGDAAKREDIRFLAPLPLFNADGSVK